MKISMMRWLDQWIGVPACACASAIEKIRRLFIGTPPVGTRLLVLKLSEMGVNVMLGGPIRRLRLTYKRENIWMMTFVESRPILEIMDLVPRENMLFVSTKSLGAFCNSLFNALGIIRKNKIDVVLNLEFFSRAGALIAWLTGAKRRVGVHNYYGEGPYCGNLMTHPVKFTPHLHISQMLMALSAAVAMEPGVLQRLEYTPPPVEPVTDRFMPTHAEQTAIAGLLAQSGYTGAERIILINANTSDRELIPLRRWDEKLYAELVRGILAAHLDALVLLTGSPKEQAGVENLESLIGSERCRSVAGKTTMRELLMLYTSAAVMVTNDSGPAHFATLTDMPVVVLFGPETPNLWRPLGGNVQIVYRNLACSPCFSISNGRRSGCRRNACMDMTPSQVQSAVDLVIGPA